MIRVPSLFVLGMVTFPLVAAAAGGPERDALLSATWLGQVGEEEGAKVAVSWKGDAPAWIEIFEDADGDGQLGRGERVVLERAVERGMEVVPVADGEVGALGLRWRGDGVEGAERLRSAQKGSTCAWQGGFELADLDGDVQTMAVWDDGSGPALFVGGEFVHAGGLMVNRIAKWDGISWSALSGPSGTGMDNHVYALTVYDDGSGAALYAGGGFVTAGGVSVNHVARWDGSMWSTLSGPSGTGTNSWVLALAPFDDGGGEALFAGGFFTTAGGVTVNRVAKWDGVGWSALTGPLGTGVNGGGNDVRVLTVYDDGDGAALYAGGGFATAGGVSVNRIAKWDGTGWSALSGPAGTGVNNTVWALTVWDDGGGSALYAGGSFTTAGGVTVNRVAKWDGSGWSALSGPAGTGMDSTVLALAVWDGGGGAALFAGGEFAAAGGVTVNRVAKWEGSGWSALSGPSGTGVSDFVRALSVWDEGGGAALYAGGRFWTAGGVAVDQVAKWDGSSWSALSSPSGTGVSDFVRAISVWDDGGGEALYAGGSFVTAGGVVVNRVAKWDGSSWSALSGPSGTGMDQQVYALAVWDDGSGPALYAGGSFGRAGGVVVNRVAKWDGSGWSALSGGVSGTVWVLAVWDDGGGEALYAGGQFTNADGLGVNRVAKWDGTSWSALSGPSGTGVDNAVFAFAVWDDGSGPGLYAGGAFTTAAGVLVNRVARWDGSGWSALSGSSGTGTDSVVRALTVWDDGSGAALYAGGDFFAAGGVIVNRVAKWDGSAWSALSGPSGAGMADPVLAVAVWDDGGGAALYAGGQFTSAGGVTVNRVAKWDGSGWSALSGPSGTGVNSTVNALAVWDEGGGAALYAGGDFTTAGGLSSHRLARYEGPCPDTSPPSDPTSVASTSHTISAYTADPTIDMSWSGAADEPGGSGLDQYRVLFDDQPTTVPDDTTTVSHTSDPHSTTSAALADGNWYFHLSTCDVAGNCTSTVHRGPYGIDTTAPSAPGTVSSSSHSSTPVADTTISLQWVAATDALAGIIGYRFGFTNSATPPTCLALPAMSFQTHATSTALADGTWYGHTCAVDFAGNLGPVATGGPFVIDTAAPTGLLLASPSHTVSTWDDDNTIGVTLSGASDANGVTGYAIAFDQNAMTDPGTTPTQAGTSYVGTASSDGSSWYAHARACDQAGNCGPVVHLGPFWIDTSAPTAPGAVSSSSHDGGATNDTTVDASWGASSDSSSGVASYRYDFTGSATPGTCASLGSTTASTSATSAALAAGTWYVHVCARDGVGLDSGVTTGGPYTIDLGAPSVTAIDSVASSGGEITEAEIVNVAITQLLVAFDEAMGEASAESLGNFVLVGAAGNGTLDSSGCSVGGDDIGITIDSADYAAQVTTLGVNGGVALGDGLYLLGVCASVTDEAGNAMGGDFSRTFRVDLTAPKVTAVDSTANTGDGSLDAGEATNAAITDLHITFDEALFDPPGDGTAGDVSNPASYLLVESGVDGTLETTTCGAVAGTDTTVGIDSATWDGPSTTVSLQIDGGALAEGLYRLFACASLTDLGGSALDGNGDHTGGDDFSRDFRVDQTDPSDPSTVESSSHTSGGWSSSTTIAMTWMGASDDAAGLDRYRVRFDQLTTTIPDDTTTVAHAADPHGTSGGPLAEGLWYFHLSTCDIAGNCTSTVHRGPYGIDTTAPSAPGTVSSSSHSATPVADTTIDASWIAATDALSGVASYRYDFTTTATPPACAALTQTTASTSASSAAVADGTWYAHVCAVDNAGNTGAVATGGPYAIDTAPPTGLLLASPSHAVSTWSNDATIDVTLSGATDATGVTGYAITFDQNAMTDPGTTPTQAGTSYVGTATSDGNSWYAHARACDGAGNCGLVVHVGPFWIDTTAPSTPSGVDSSSHTVGTPSSDATIDTEWDASSDTTSGVAGYAWTFLGADSWSCDGVIDGTDLSTTSVALSTGEYWFHVCSVDEAGNQSAVTTIGPFELDLVGPVLTTVDTVADTGNGELEDGEVTESSITQLLVSFDQELAQPAAEDLANWVLVEAGAGGTIETAGCTVAPTDVEVAPTSASLLGDQQSVRLDVGAGFALPAGSYRLWACSGITDELGNEAGASSLDFEVTAGNLVPNPNFDDGILPWVAGGTRPGDLGWQGVDAQGKATSGSVVVATTAGTGATTTAEACLALEPGIPFVLGGAIEVTGGSGADPAVTVDLVGSTNTTCQASGDTGGAVTLATGPTAGWVPFSAARAGSWGSVLARFTVAGGASSTHSVRIDLLRLDGPLFADGFESGDTGAWSAQVP